jgi:hypothetical protein
VDARLSALIATTEKVFHLPEGALLAADRSQPLVSFRQLAMVVAADDGHGQAALANAFQRDRKTVKFDVGKARSNLAKGHNWWGYAKADLIDAWHDAVEAAQNV